MRLTTERIRAKRRLIAPMLSSLLILAFGFFSRAPIVDALTSSRVPGASLQIPTWYAVLAPISNLFDGLTLLSLPQIFSALGFLCFIAGAFRVRSTTARSRNQLRAHRVRDHFRFAANVAGTIIAICGVALLIPRPMASLRVNDRDLVTIDFHSHTSASHDGRPGFTPEANREWHRKAGFDVAYITDHHTFAGALAAMRANPRVAGDGTVLLAGLEYRDADEHVIALGLDPATTDPERREWHPLNSTATTTKEGAPALLILSLPGNVTQVPADEEIGFARLSAIELSDGSPHGTEQAADDRAAILAMAKRLNLSLVSGSDNHGWGHAAMAWSVMRIPEWRAMSPAELDIAIRSTLVSNHAAAVTVVSRRIPSAASPFATAMTGPELGWEIARDITWPERLAWVLWIWAGWSFVLLAERRRSARGLHITWAMPEIIPAMPAETFAVRDR
jgi:predicted metal-dependent phosphoesterase TrpH